MASRDDSGRGSVFGGRALSVVPPNQTRSTRLASIDAPIYAEEREAGPRMSVLGPMPESPDQGAWLRWFPVEALSPFSGPLYAMRFGLRRAQNHNLLPVWKQDHNWLIHGLFIPTLPWLLLWTCAVSQPAGDVGLWPLWLLVPLNWCRSLIIAGKYAYISKPDREALERLDGEQYRHEIQRIQLLSGWLNPTEETLRFEAASASQKLKISIEGLYFHVQDDAAAERLAELLSSTRGRLYGPNDVDPIATLDRQPGAAEAATLRPRGKSQLHEHASMAIDGDGDSHHYCSAESMLLALFEAASSAINLAPYRRRAFWVSAVTAAILSIVAAHNGLYGCLASTCTSIDAGAGTGPRIGVAWFVFWTSLIIGMFTTCYFLFLFLGAAEVDMQRRLNVLKLLGSIITPEYSSCKEHAARCAARKLNEPLISLVADARNTHSWLTLRRVLHHIGRGYQLRCQLVTASLAIFSAVAMVVETWHLTQSGEAFAGAHSVLEHHVLQSSTGVALVVGWLGLMTQLTLCKLIVVGSLANKQTLSHQEVVSNIKAAGHYRAVVDGGSFSLDAHNSELLSEAYKVLQCADAREPVTVLNLRASPGLVKAIYGGLAAYLSASTRYMM